jgi:Signal transduction histidine kinase
MDIIQNSITAKADRIEIIVEADVSVWMLKITIKDNGCGMDQELLARVTDPFSTTRTTRKVGLGIPLFKAAAERTEGELRISSKKGYGTTVITSFGIKNIDRPPLGDVAETIAGIILSSPEIELFIRFVRGSEIFKMNTSEIKVKLGDVPITEFEVLAWIKEYVNEGIIAIFGGVLDEIDSSIGRDKEEDS